MTHFRRLGILTLLAAALTTTAAVAEEKPKSQPDPKWFTDPAKAGPDFAIQGEYTGGSAREQVPVGAQVVALGGGKFAVKLLTGGLPGAGWNGKDQHEFKTSSDGGSAKVMERTFEVKFAPEAMTLVDDKETLAFKRVVRTSPTLGEKPPEGATVLFDGTKADAWDKGELVEGSLLKMGTTSKATFGDISHLHVEFILSYMPKARGQGRSNSGVYVQGRYEVQVLDSFGLKGLNNECGGIYEISAPLVNMCYPPLQWQTYDIEYSSAHYADGKKTSDAEMTVRHNGVLIQDKVKLTHATRSSVVAEGAEKGPIHLQNHGDPVYYRNIWLVEKK